MINATFYKNGFVIKGHARPDICSELSMHTFTLTNIMLNIDNQGAYVAGDGDGYGHFIFNHENPTLAHIFSVCRAMLPAWSERWGWESHLMIEDKDEVLSLESIETTEILSA